MNKRTKEKKPQKDLKNRWGVFSKKKKDIRLEILEYFENLNKSTSETVANQYLSTLHNDLGTIRRALIELIQEGHIRISSINNQEPVTWLIKNWDTTTNSTNKTQDELDKKSSRRLIEKVGNHAKVPKIRLHTTVKGLMFIKEYRRFKYLHYWRIIYILIGALLGFLLNIIYESVKPK